MLEKNKTLNKSNEQKRKNQTYMQNGNAIVLHITKNLMRMESHMKRGAK